MSELVSLSDPNTHIQGNTEYVRNPEGFWINTKPFRQEAINYEKYGYFCPDPYGTPGWKDYWTEQHRRGREGYSVGGVKITGFHYMYLNFCQIMLVKQVKGDVGVKVMTFPDFWDGDYHYFWSLEIAKNGCTQEEYDGRNLNLLNIPSTELGGGKHMIVGKSRRKGYSYKNGAICASTFVLERQSLSLLCAFDKKYLYPEGTMGMTSSYLDLFNEYDGGRCGFRRLRQVTDRQDIKKASFKRNNAESGTKSRVMALTFKDNPDAARGKDAKILLFEESGKFPNLIPSYKATEPALRAGRFTTGQIIIFGTGGDMESGTVDFAEMFYNPGRYRLLKFQNIWDKDAEASTCGFFHPVTWNMEGFYDENGNSDIKEATKREMENRQIIIEDAGSSAGLQEHAQEWALKPEESFGSVSLNDFPVAELRHRLKKVEREKLYERLGTCGNFVRDNGILKFEADLSGKSNPIIRYKHDSKDLRGSIVMFEQYDPKCTYGLGYDPYAQDQTSGVSIGSIYVMGLSGKHLNQIVCTYNGRPSTAEECDRIFYMLCEYYHAYERGMFENMHLHTKSNAVKFKATKYLAYQPDLVISQAVKDSKVARIYGCHMNVNLRAAGVKLIKEFLMEIVNYDDEGRKILRLDTLIDIGLIEELIKYNLKGNFDRVIALMMVLFLKTERDLESTDHGSTYDQQLEEEMNELMNMNYA